MAGIHKVLITYYHWLTEVGLSTPNGPIGLIIAEYIPPISEAVKNVNNVPCVSITYGLFNGFLNLWFNTVVIAPVNKPIKIAGNGSGFNVDVAPHAIPP